MACSGKERNCAARTSLIATEVILSTNHRRGRHFTGRFLVTEAVRSRRGEERIMKRVRPPGLSITLHYAGGGAQLVRSQCHRNVSPPKWVYKARGARESLFKLSLRAGGGEEEEATPRRRGRLLVYSGEQRGRRFFF